MSIVLYGAAAVIVVGAAIAGTVLWGRRSQSIEEGMREFRDGLAALDPANDPLSRRGNFKQPPESTGDQSRTGPRSG